MRFLLLTADMRIQGGAPTLGEAQAIAARKLAKAPVGTLLFLVETTGGLSQQLSVDEAGRLTVREEPAGGPDDGESEHVRRLQVMAGRLRGWVLEDTDENLTDLLLGAADCLDDAAIFAAVQDQLSRPVVPADQTAENVVSAEGPSVTMGGDGPAAGSTVTLHSSEELPGVTTPTFLPDA